MKQKFSLRLHDDFNRRMKFQMDEYMTYFMFKDLDESDAKTSYSSSLAASVGASFFKIAVIPIPVNTRSGQLSKALSEGPLL